MSLNLLIESTTRMCSCHKLAWSSHTVRLTGECAQDWMQYLTGLPADVGAIPLLLCATKPDLPGKCTPASSAGNCLFVLEDSGISKKFTQSNFIAVGNAVGY